MKFHPHLHIIINSNIVFNSKFNKLWRRMTLNNLSLASNKYNYGYYVWSSRHAIKPKQLAKYIARYVRHPAIADSRIKDVLKDKITFCYSSNNGNSIIVTQSTASFITTLIQHIPPRQFKTIRYYKTRRTKILSNNSALP